MAHVQHLVFEYFIDSNALPGFFFMLHKHWPPTLIISSFRRVHSSIMVPVIKSNLFRTRNPHRNSSTLSVIAVSTQPFELVERDLIIYSRFLDFELEIDF
ncbi:hypothetical protein TNCT_566981 [Trichonephila clavata]|uniref:Uncharacterized protein n=1 Tax=Trichonephila clavata TaxID=2740835 RepID=A0A8X6FMA5_TRICU|nr:hypothetical protein TNCT_566981 [Trichonephila clavata]